MFVCLLVTGWDGTLSHLSLLDRVKPFHFRKRLVCSSWRTDSQMLLLNRKGKEEEDDEEENFLSSTDTF